MTNRVSLRAAVYTRYSHADGDSDSCAVQLARATEIIEAQGWVFAGEFSDDGISGREMVRRSGFNRLIAASPTYDIVVVRDMDRFARGEVFAVGAVLQKLGDAQIRVYQYLKGAFVRLDGEHALITAIEMFGNRNEALKTSARTKEKLKHKDEEGTITNLTPYGFKNVRRRRSDGAVGIFIERKGTDGVAVPHETEHPILVEMADLFLKLGSYNAVANNLNARKVPAPRGGPLGWSSESVRRILGNTAYRGTVKRGQLPTGEVAGSLVRIKADPDDVRSYDRPEYRVWDDETVAKIDALMKARARTTTWSPQARRHLASGFLRCASCGGGVSIHKHATYGCQRRSKGCKGIGYRKEVVVDAAIVSACFGLLADEVINKAREIIAQALDVRAEHDHRLVEVDRLKREIATAERRVKGSQEMAAESDGAERVHHRAALRDQLERLEALRVQLAEVEAQEPAPDPKTLLATFDERVRELRDTLSKGGLEAQPAVAAILGGERLTVHRRDDGRWDLVGETDLQVLAGGKPEVSARRLRTFPPGDGGEPDTPVRRSRTFLPAGTVELRAVA